MVGLNVLFFIILFIYDLFISVFVVDLLSRRTNNNKMVQDPIHSTLKAVDSKQSNLYSSKWKGSFGLEYPRFSLCSAISLHIRILWILRCDFCQHSHIVRRGVRMCLTLNYMRNMMDAVYFRIVLYTRICSSRYIRRFADIFCCCYLFICMCRI